MFWKRWTIGLTLLSGLLTAPWSFAQTMASNPGPEEEDGRVGRLEARVAELERMLRLQRDSEYWSAEIDRRIAEAMKDARERPTLTRAALFAGIDEKGTVFLASADGQSLLEIRGQIQFRYYWNNQDDRNAPLSGDSASGFEVRRAKLKLFSDLPGGWSYKLIFATLRPGEIAVSPDTYTEQAKITHAFNDHWAFHAGYFKLPFSRQELIISGGQTGLDRGVSHEFFTLNFAEQVSLEYRGEGLRAQASLSDGANTALNGIPNNTSQDFAVTARGEVKVYGDWSESRSEFASENSALFLAAAGHYEKLDGDFLRNGILADDTLVWTGEVLWKTPGLAVSAAVFGSHVEAVGADDVQQYGAYVQADVLVAEGWDIYGRYEVIDDGGVIDANPLDDDSDLTHAITLGVNRHLSRNIKITSDVVYLFAGNDPAAVGRINGGAVSGAIGLQPGLNDDDGQIAWRTQVQLLY